MGIMGMLSLFVLQSLQATVPSPTTPSPHHPPPIHGIWKFLDQGSSPRHSSNLSHCSSSNRSLTHKRTLMLVILTSLVPWHSLLKPLLAHFCGSTLVSLRYDVWCSSSVAVQPHFYHSLPIKSGDQTTSRQCWEGVLASGFLWGFSQYIIPFLVFFFLQPLYVIFHSP